MQVQAGQCVQVVTAFAGRPTGALSPLASTLHRRWALGYAAPEARRDEDRAALSQVGATAVHWELPECIYRRAPDGTYLYTDEESLWGPLHPADDTLIEPLARRISTLPETALLCVPLGVGGHVDHRLLRRAAEATGRPLLYYEEYPYAEESQTVQAALGSGAWADEPVFVTERALTAKIAAVACYRSQLSTFWADEEDMARHIHAYALRVGKGRPAERRWRRMQGRAGG